MQSRGNSVEQIPKRVCLRESEVVEIYQFKVNHLQSTSIVSNKPASLRGLCIPLASRFNVHPKVVRDIWNRKTWGHVTENLWHLDPDTKFSPASSLNDGGSEAAASPRLSNSCTPYGIGTSTETGTHERHNEEIGMTPRATSGSREIQWIVTESEFGSPFQIGSWELQIDRILGKAYESKLCEHFNCEICHTSRMEYFPQNHFHEIDSSNIVR